jgi:hypothetical protein
VPNRPDTYIHVSRYARPQRPILLRLSDHGRTALTRHAPLHHHRPCTASTRPFKAVVVGQRWPKALEAREPAPLTHLQQRIIANISTLEAQHTVSDIYPRDFKQLCPQREVKCTCAPVHSEEKHFADSAHAGVHPSFMQLCTQPTRLTAPS